MIIIQKIFGGFSSLAGRKTEGIYPGDNKTNLGPFG